MTWQEILYQNNRGWYERAARGGRITGPEAVIGISCMFYCSSFLRWQIKLENLYFCLRYPAMRRLRRESRMLKRR